MTEEELSAFLESDEIFKDGPLSPEDFHALMVSIQCKFGDDAEECHIEMDIAMCHQLIALGYGEAMSVFDNAQKWYA